MTINTFKANVADAVDDLKYDFECWMAVRESEKAPLSIGLARSWQADMECRRMIADTIAKRDRERYQVTDLSAWAKDTVRAVKVQEKKNALHAANCVVSAVAGYAMYRRLKKQGKTLKQRVPYSVGGALISFAVDVAIMKLVK